MKFRVATLALLLSLSGWAWSSDNKTQHDWATRYRDWLCRVSGYGCQPVKKLAPARDAETPRPKGRSLMTYDLKGPQGRLIWRDCDCWSPTPVGSESLAVLTEDGIWLVPLSHPAGRKLLFKSADVLELLEASGTPAIILFLQASTNSGCAFEPHLLNTETLRVTPAPAELNLACGSERDDQNIEKPSQIIEGKRLRVSLEEGRFKIYLEADNESKQLLPAQGSKGDCFDPVWITNSLLAFVSGR